MGANATKKDKKNNQGTKNTVPVLETIDASSSNEDQGTTETSTGETPDVENGETSQIGVAQVTSNELLKIAEKVEESSKDENDGQISDNSGHLVVELAEQALKKRHINKNKGGLSEHLNNNLGLQTLCLRMNLTTLKNLGILVKLMNKVRTALMVG